MTVFVVQTCFEYEDGFIQSFIDYVFDSENKAKEYCDSVNKQSVAQWVCPKKLKDLYTKYGEFEVE